MSNTISHFNYTLEMLEQRTQLMIDIDCIVESFWYATWPEGEYQEDMDELTKKLCDAVVKHFPLTPD